MYSSEWDDFESIPHTNIEAELALQLCFWFANKYPSEEDIPTVIGASEKANPYFKAIGLALKYNNFSNLEHQEIIEQFKGKSYNTALPEIIENILMKYID